MSGRPFTCFDCSGFLFRPGPCGGLSQNIECVGCGSRFNVAHWRGMQLSVERIANDSEWRVDLFPRVLQ
ncbi:hypothetical protein A1D31_22245 [Bradyrhizobium liaoningense]|nr:hypothetical protein A1D31_22245 [Bradyrhizobium liaoningense]